MSGEGGTRRNVPLFRPKRKRLGFVSQSPTERGRERERRRIIERTRFVKRFPLSNQQEKIPISATKRF